MTSIASSISLSWDSQYFFIAKEDPLDRLVAKVKEVVSNILEAAVGVAILSVGIVLKATEVCFHLALTAGAICATMAVGYVALHVAVAVTCAAIYAALIVGYVGVVLTVASMPAIIVLSIIGSL